MVRYFYAWTPLLIVGTLCILSLPWLGLIVLMIVAVVALPTLALALVIVPYMVGQALGRHWHQRADASYAQAAWRGVDYARPRLARPLDPTSRAPSFQKSPVS